MADDKTIPLTLFRSDLSRVIKSVHAGTSYTITLSGIPIATIAPYQTSAFGAVNFEVDASGPSTRKPEVKLPLSAQLVEDDDPLL